MFAALREHEIRVQAVYGLCVGKACVKSLEGAGMKLDHLVFEQWKVEGEKWKVCEARAFFTFHFELSTS